MEGFKNQGRPEATENKSGSEKRPLDSGKFSIRSNIEEGDGGSKLMEQAVLGLWKIWAKQGRPNRYHTGLV